MSANKKESAIASHNPLTRSITTEAVAASSRSFPLASCRARYVSPPTNDGKKLLRNVPAT